jgi:signal peptidase
MTTRWRGWQAATLAAVLATLLPLTTFLVATWLLGWQLQSVQTGSMSPTFAVGSLLVVGQVDASQVEAGMAITFEDPAAAGKLVTHRVVKVAPGQELAFITKGDANATADVAPVPARLVRGRVLWSVSQLGTVMDWLQWPRSFVLLVLAPTVLLLGLELRAGTFGRVFGRSLRTPIKVEQERGNTK